MTRKVDPEERALRLLRKLAAEGNAAAAAQLVLAERRRKRDQARQAKLDAEAKQRNATSTSRSTSLIGPPQPDGYAERMLRWLMSGEDEFTPLGARCEREFQEWKAACDVFDWPGDGTYLRHGIASTNRVKEPTDG
jgi:hypothetical protein